MIKFTEVDSAESKKAARKPGDKNEAKPAPAVAPPAPAKAAGVAAKGGAPKRKSGEAV